MELYQANRQWATRPDDERFENMSALLAACKTYAGRSREASIPFKQLRVTAFTEEDDIRLEGPKAVPTSFVNFSFKQFCSRVGAPASYLAKLPAGLLASVLNHGIEHDKSEEDTVKLLVQWEADRPEGDNIIVRAATSEIYARIWNWEVAEWVQENLSKYGWRTPPARPAHEGQKGARPATAEDMSVAGSFGLSVNVGDMIAPAGLYASDHDCFMFLVNEQVPIDGGNGEILYRGCFIKNSEVGAASASVTTFLYEGVCGNHIVWSVQDVTDIRIRHVGEQARVKLNKAFEKIVTDFMHSSGAADEKKIQAAKHTKLGKDEDEVVQKLFEKRILSLADARAAFDIANSAEVHGPSNTVWGMVSGTTRLSQNTPYMDKREELDRAAHKILNMAF